MKKNLLATEKYINSFLVLGLALIVSWGILVRYLPLSGVLMVGVEESGRLGLVWLWLLAGAAVTRLGQHFRLELVVRRLPDILQHVFRVFGELLALILMSIFVRYSIAFYRDQLGNSTLNLQWPYVVFVIPLILGGTLIFIYSLVRLVSNIRDVYK